jgi:serine/threonine protein kinase
VSLTLNQEFGPYVLIDQIAVGGMAEIYLAKTRGFAGFEKYLALKVIHPNYANDEQFVQMLIDEAKISVGLNHANIAQIFDLGRHGDTYYISMEYIDGFDLFRIMRRLSELNVDVPIDMAAYIAQEVCTGLDYAHKTVDSDGQPLNLIHRDISPQNIIISRAGEVKIVDFGIAKAANRSRKTQAGVIKGKYFYMSPEQAWGDPIDHRTDIFSAGIILYEVLTGQMLYLEEDIHKLLDMVRKADIPRPTTRRPNIPPQLETIVMKALAKRSADRWQSAHEFQMALTNFLYSYAPSFTPDRLSEMVHHHLGAPEHSPFLNPPPSSMPPQPSPDIATQLGSAPQRSGAVATAEMGDLLDRQDVPLDQHSVIFNYRDLNDDDDVGEKTQITAPPDMLLNMADGLADVLEPQAALGDELDDDELDDSPTLIGESTQAGPAPPPRPRHAATSQVPAEVIVSAPELEAAKLVGKTTDPDLELSASAGISAQHERTSADSGAHLSAPVLDQPAQRLQPSLGKPKPAWPTLPAAARQQRPTGPVPFGVRPTLEDLAPPAPSAQQEPPPEPPTAAWEAPGADERTAQAQSPARDENWEVTLPGDRQAAWTTPPLEPTMPAPPNERKPKLTGPVPASYFAPPAMPPLTAAAGLEPGLDSMTGPDQANGFAPQSPPQSPPHLPPQPQATPISPAQWTPQPQVMQPGWTAQPQVMQPGGTPAVAPQVTPHPLSLHPQMTPPMQPIHGQWTPQPQLSPVGLHPQVTPSLSPVAAPPGAVVPGAVAVVGHDPFMAAVPPRRRRGLWFVIVALLFLGGAGGALVLLLMTPDKPERIALYVKSVPEGATVTINGEEIPQKTPVKIPIKDPKAPQTVRVTLKNYEPWVKTRVITEGEKSIQMLAVLTSLTGRLEIGSTPAGASIYVNNELRGSTPFILKNLNLSKPVVFELRKRGFVTVTHTLKWEDQTYKNVMIPMRKAK